MFYLRKKIRQAKKNYYGCEYYTVMVQNIPLNQFDKENFENYI